jgi:phage baseplate assembly protein gpV
MKTMSGVVTAVVTNATDPDGQGRVQVQYQWLPGTTQSAWAAVSAPLAGKGRGMWFMPELQDEVLLSFDHGDFDHPFIVGYLWNGVDSPPDTDNQNRTIKTPSGHSIVFGDGSGKIVITSAGGTTVTIDGDSCTVNASASVTLQAAQINLLQDASHPVVYGDVLLAYLNQLLIALQAHLHVGELALGIFPVTPAPPSAPFPPVTLPLNSLQVLTG